MTRTRKDNDVSKHFIALMNALNDLWGALSYAERVVMIFILNRTVRFNKWDEVIPRRHFIEGVPNFPTGPSGISESIWRRCVRTLSAEGLIQYHGGPEGTYVLVIPQRILDGPLRAPEGRSI